MKKKVGKGGRPRKKDKDIKIPKRFLVRGLVSNKGGTDSFGNW